MSERASIFDSGEDFDVSGFAPKEAERAGEVSAEALRAVSEASKFPSREPSAAPKSLVKQQEAGKREPRRYRTGRNVQLNLKVRPETVASFYAIADRQGWVLGETLEKAISALDRELASAKT